MRTIPDFIGAFKIWAAPSKAQKLLGVTGTPSSRNSHDAIHQIQVGFLHLAVGIGGLEGQGLAAAVPRLGIFGAREGMGRAPSSSSLQAKSPACSPFDSYFDFLFSILISYLFPSIHPSLPSFFLTSAAPPSPRGSVPALPTLSSPSKPVPVAASNPSCTPALLARPAASPAGALPAAANIWATSGHVPLAPGDSPGAPHPSPPAPSLRMLQPRCFWGKSGYFCSLLDCCEGSTS